ncbi:MAG: serine/threonine protein kinase [Deltaproteobacteria bacterium]|nr:MAG: serine/threonine protein kinase [Deltaproteobacteria bacterium]TMQ12091.1 MAG: serine/threonine protein kinase [Deltaproteobacteria bacterium]
MPEEARPRTNTRLRGEAPPGLQFTGEEGRQRIGRYEVIKTIGKGAMGVVYKARDPLLDRVVAVKTIMSPQGQGRRVRSAFLERFQREAKAAAKMQHPAIVTIFDVGLDEDSGAPFMVLEYLPGESLADRLDRVRFPLARGVQIALDLASALAFAHRQRIVHRDVKPANVLHAGDNRWKLADFGIARMPDSDLTQVGIFMGTPGYSPPEAIREGRYTPQADVFAWGAVFYELLSGRIPYEGPDTKTTNGYVVQGNAPAPSRHDTSIPEPLATVTMTALQPSDRTRFKDGSEAEQALREAWDRCLTQGFVHPAILAMEEMPHDKVPARMHEPRGVPARPPVPLLASDSNEMTAIDEKMLAKPLAIESQKPGRIGDDDPTMLSVREEERRGQRDGARGDRPSGKARALEPDRSYPDGSGPREAPPTEKDPSKIQPPPADRSLSAERISPKLPVIILVAMLVLAVAAAGLYMGGVIKI